jgi:hypothetical protein
VFSHYVSSKASLAKEHFLFLISSVKMRSMLMRNIFFFCLFGGFLQFLAKNKNKKSNLMRPKYY